MSSQNLSTAIELLVFFTIIAAVVYLAMRIRKNTAYRLAIGLALLATFLIIWVNLAVGIIGEPDNPANFLYLGVPMVAFMGALIARLQPPGMSVVLFVTAGVQGLVALITLLGGWATPVSWAWAMLLINGMFTALWVASALLFRKAATQMQTEAPAL